MPPNDPENLSAYLDGELTDVEAAELEAELARDPVLRAELSELESVAQWLREEGAEPAPFGFHRRVMDRVEAEHPTGAARWAWLRRPFGVALEGWLVAAAAAAVLFVALPRSAPESSSELGPLADRPAAMDLDPVEPVEEAADGGDAAEPGPGTEPGVVRTGRSKRIREPVQSSGDGELPPIGIPPLQPLPGGEDEAAPGDTGPRPETRFPRGFAFTIRSADPAMKRRVLAVASRYGVPMALTGEQPSSQFTADRETILVEIPSGKLALLDAELKRLGYSDPIGVADDHLVRGRMMVRIHLELAND